MRAYININQRAFTQLSILKNIKLDLIDATIFEYIVKFSVSNSATKQIIDNKLFAWCSYQKIIDDNPLLNINSKKAIELRLNKLINIGLFDKFTDKEKGNKTFFNVTDLAFELVIENTNLSNEDYQPLSNEDYYNSKLNNNTTEDYTDYKTLWNEFATKNKKAKLSFLSKDRKKKIALRLKEYKNLLEIFTYVLKKSENSQFLLNSNFYTFDWLFENDTNILKVYEGKYDNGKSQEVVV